jgi:hypothetical protein
MTLETSFPAWPWIVQTRWIVTRRLGHLNTIFKTPRLHNYIMLMAIHLLGEALCHCPSKKEKGEKPQSCSYQAEAKNDYRVERCVAGQ